MAGHHLLAVVDRQLALKGESNLDRATSQLSGDTIAATTDVDVGIPADLSVPIPLNPAADSERIRPPLGAPRRRPQWSVFGGRLPSDFASRLRIDSPLSVIL